jgi:hypothetical protein
LHAHNNAFLVPFAEDLEKSSLLRGADSVVARGILSWQGRYNVYDARLHAFAPAAHEKTPAQSQSLKDWQRVWGQTGEHAGQTLEASHATRTITLEGKASSQEIQLQLERLALPRQLRVDLTQGFPGADLVSLGILKKKG